MMEASKPLVSIVLATYNGQGFLAEQIESILTQSYSNTELIITDDASSDGTGAIIDKYSHLQNISVIRNRRNAGSTVNFQIGLAHAKGDYVAFSDQDDVWMPGKIEKSVSALLEKDADLVFCDALLMDDNGKLLGSSLWREIGFTKRKQTAFLSNAAFPMLLRDNYVTGATMVLKRKLALQACPISPGWVHDAWMVLIATCCSAHVTLIDEPLMSYRIHAGQQIGVKRKGNRFTDSRKWFDAKARMWAALRSFLLDKSGSGEFNVDSAALRLVEMNLSHIIFRQNLPDSRRSRIRPVLSELASGGYFRYSRGLSSMMKDLFVSHEGEART